MPLANCSLSMLDASRLSREVSQRSLNSGVVAVESEILLRACEEEIRTNQSQGNG